MWVLACKAAGIAFVITAGMPTKQVEAQAEVMAEVFIFNVDSLVTKDYLDARLGTLEANMDGKIDSLAARMDDKFRLIYWMLAVVIASTTVPALHGLFGA